MRKKIFYIVLAILAGIILAIIISSKLIYNKVFVKANVPKQDISVTPTATPTPDPLAPYSIAMLGYGGGNHDGGLLTDSIMVAQIIPREEIIKLISIPRDLWVPIPIDGNETKNFKINAAYAIGHDDKQYKNKKIEFTGKAGGGELSKYVIQNVLGINIDNFIAIDFEGFTKTIDILGGIEVKVERTFDDIHYPIEEKVNDTCEKPEEEIKALEATMSGDKLDNMFTCRYEILHFNKGLQHMDGITALKFARSRHSLQDGGDFNRAARQRLVVTSTRDKIMSIGFLTKIIPTIKTLSYHLTTDIDLDKINKLISDANELSSYKILHIALTDQNVLINSKSSSGQWILAPQIGENNFGDIHNFIATSSATKLN